MKAEQPALRKRSTRNCATIRERSQTLDNETDSTALAPGGRIPEQAREIIRDSLIEANSYQLPARGALLKRRHRQHVCIFGLSSAQSSGCSVCHALSRAGRQRLRRT